MTAALNGCDFDGDLVMLTDNNILVNRLESTPTVMCIQRKAKKRIVCENDVVQSNIDSFGNDIGKVTNRITSMFEMQSHFDEGSDEYSVLDYRIKCGQLIQQNVIDKSKGIVAKPMPRTWHDRHSVNQMDNEKERSFYRSILADKKPYFMKYIYPDLMKQYNTYNKNVNLSCMREFGISLKDLLNLECDTLSERQRDFIRYYKSRLPVGTGRCVMNRICHSFEDRFDSYSNRYKDIGEFDYNILKSGAEYTQAQYTAIKKLYDEYNRNMRNYAVFAAYERVDTDDSLATVSVLRDEFMRECEELSPNIYILGDILLDICYSSSSTKRFVWDMYPQVVIENMLKNSGGIIQFPTPCDDGDIEYGGMKFTITTLNVGVDE